MPRHPRTERLRRDLAGMADALDEIYPMATAPGATPIVPEKVHSIPRPAPRPGSPNAVRADMGLPPASTSVTIAAHLLGPEHCGRFIEVNRPMAVLDQGRRRPAGPCAGRLVGYQAAPTPTGPNTGAPVRAFDLLLQQGPHITTATVSWADPIRIA